MVLEKSSSDNASVMKKSIMLVIPLLVSALLFAYPEEPTEPKHSEVSWHSITVIDYKPGTENAARELILKFESASEKAGTSSPVIYWFKSGKYDLVVTWELKEGHVDFQGNWSPDGPEWWNALVEQEGSEEAARTLQSGYNELIASSVTNIARKAK
jgi:hypothetical protein